MLKFKIKKNVEKRKNCLEIWWIAIFPQNLEFNHLMVSEKCEL